MFEPGHLHRVNPVATPDQPAYSIDLYYEVHPGGEEVVVFAHGAGGNHLSWWQHVPEEISPIL